MWSPVDPKPELQVPAQELEVLAPELEVPEPVSTQQTAAVRSRLRARPPSTFRFGSALREPPVHPKPAHPRHVAGQLPGGPRRWVGPALR
mmetsp:Transcript_62616/g.173559  ORF Transcript_62616/g.173559 Transcript_62616/m.173559 type:complete len:90 (-) Transcript_62616:99-368(-)